MSLPLTVKLAMRNLRRNRRRTVLTGLSMFGGYILLVLSLSLQDGSYDSVLRTYTRDHSGHIQLTQAQYLDQPTLYRTVHDYQSWIERIEQFPFVRQVTPRIQAAALAYGTDKAAPAIVYGIDPQREQQTSYLGRKISQGTFFNSDINADGYYQTMLGYSLARQLRLTVDDELVLISQGADGSMANDVYIVSAIIGDSDAPERLNVYLPLNAAQQFFVLPHQVHQLVILTNDYLQAEPQSQQLNTQLDTGLRPQQLHFSPWQVIEHEFYRTMKADKQGNVVSMYIVVFLVCLGVLNTILMNILERTGEFGVLKAIGTSPWRIYLQILLETLLLALLSCVAGLIIALPLNYYFTHIGITLAEPMEISGLVFEKMTGIMTVPTFLNPVIIICLASVAVAMLPAIRAARLVPLDAMRRL
ncbi:ABC transporter permease [Gynuella sunshinyii]|uniref:ABC-type transport system, involved in lipoprotein release, permease component n=1 Tax=Gynuella sunshinyii YC6258 TaxID=1445510 RepID=A0A0C5VPA3_9GAMM|nr:FtsX-like permease family protein [Gynuella sunshinyii]AJQ92089.1 ABC-type transport system, involved in lipoprotein release, permease component [Gynuella sunshinyii YC6258]